MNSPRLPRAAARPRILCLAFLALTWLTPALVAAPSPLQAEFTPAGRWSSTAWAVGVELAGNLAYIAEGSAGLTILNLDGEGGPVRVGGYNTPGDAGHVRVVGTKAYVADGDSGLQILDVGDPTRPTRLGGFNTPGSGLGVAVLGTTAFVADYEGGMAIVDVTDPVTPQGVAVFLDSRTVRHVRASGDLIYLVDDLASLRVLDVSEPAAPRVVGRYLFDGLAGGFDVEGERAYLLVERRSGGTTSPGLRIVDVSNPADPRALGEVALEGLPTQGSVTAHGDHVFVTVGGGLSVIDVRDPARPEVVGQLAETGLVAVSEGRMVLAQGDAGVQLLKLRFAPSQMLHWSLGDLTLLPANLPHALNVTASSGLPVRYRIEAGPATIAEGVLTIHGPGPVAVTAEQAGSADFAAVRETRVFNRRQLSWSRAGGLDTAGVAVGVEWTGDLAYVADGGSGVHVFDVRDPANPVRIGGFDTPGSAERLKVVGTLAYVADGPSGLLILDVSTPSRPVRKGSLAIGGGYSSGIAVSETNAYVAAGESGLVVVNVSDPTRPVRSGAYNTPGIANDLRFSDKTVYLADGASGLQVVDVSDPARPVRLGGIDTTGDAQAVELFGTSVAVADGYTGLVVADVGNPTKPVLVGGASLNGPPLYRPGVGPTAVDVRIREGLAFVAGGSLGVQAFDVSRLEKPVHVATFATAGDAAGLAVSESHVWVAAFDRGLEIVEYHLGQPQTLTWTGSPERVIPPGAARTTGAASSSGLPVTVGVAAGPAILENGLLTITNLGTVTLVLEQAGDKDFLPAREFRTLNQQAFTASRLGGLSIGAAQDVEANADYAFVLENEGRTGTPETGGGVRVIDLRGDQSPPREIARLALPGFLQDLQVVGDMAYVAAGTDGLYLVDVSSPSQPVRRGTFNTAGNATCVEVSDGVAYVADGTSGLQVIDVRDPSTPVRRGGIGASVAGNRATQVRVVDQVGYVIEMGSAFPPVSVLRVLDLTTLTPIRPLGILSLRSDPFQLAVDGRIAGVVTRDEAMVVDASHPSNPVVIARLPSVSAFSTVSLEGGYLFAESKEWNEGTQIFDLSNPSTPSLVGSLPVSNLSALSVVGDRLHVVSSGAERFETFRLERGYPQRITWTGSTAGRLEPAAEYPLVATSDSGLPVTRRVAFGPATWADGRLTVTGTGLIQVTVEQAGDGAYLPVRETRSFNVRRFDPRWLGDSPTGDARDVSVAGRYAFVADYGDYDDNTGRWSNGGLRVVDVWDPRHPVRVGNFQTNASMATVQVVGNNAFIGDYGPYDGGWAGGGLRVVDASDPMNPKLESAVDFRGTGYELQVAEGLAYLAVGSAVEIMDVRAPSKPVSLGRLVAATSVDAFEVAGLHAYVGGGSEFTIWDLSDPAMPRALGSADLFPVSIRWVEVSGNLAYVGGDEGMAVVDVHDPARPLVLAQLPEAAGIRELEVRGDVGYITVLERGLGLLDLRNPAHPVVADEFLGLPGLQFDVAGNYAYLAGAALHIVELGREVTIPAPSLRRSGAGLELAWPARLGLILQHRADFAPGTPWRDVGPMGPEVGGEIRTTVDPSGASGFYRLQRP
jgi:hypothetical protein